MLNPFPSGLDRFEFRTRIGQGGMGVVWRVYDRELGRDIALKTLASADADAIYRLKREFRSLAELSHKNLITLYELFSQDETWFFTMELVQGVNFLTWVTGQETVVEATQSNPVVALATDSGTEATRPKASPPQPLPPPDEATAPKAAAAPTFESAPRDSGFVAARLYDAVKQLTHGLQALHDAGKEHRDLKPANVMVTHDGRVVLLDFGLALDRKSREFYEDTSESVSTSGTPAYMAPERHLGDSPTVAADWYALGVMLYEALTGVKPYVRLMDVVAGLPPPDPHERNPEAPADLSRLALDLLSKDPAKRPHGPEILKRLFGTSGKYPALRPKTAEALVGRSAHLGALEGAFEARKRAGAVQVRVQGRSGFGKSALVQHFLEQLIASKRAVVLAGRCYERESVPFKVFDSVIDSLTRYLQTLKPADIRELIPPDVKTLARLFPSLLRVQAVADAEQPDVGLRDVRELVRRAALALKRLFDRIAERQPLVLYVDDLQWGDVDSSRLLLELLTPPPPKLMLVVSFRSEDLQSPVLTQLLEATAESNIHTETVEVGPLSSEEATELAKRIIGQAPGTDRVIQEAAGSPFFVQQLAQFAAQSPDVLAEGRQLSLADVLRANLSQLAGPARELLTAVAVAGRPIARFLAVQAAGMSDQAAEAFSGLRTGNWLRVGGPKPTDTIETYHDKIRETLVTDVAPERLKAIHRTLAELLEGQTPQDAEALTTHWLGAGEPKRAVPFALTAAKNAAQALAFTRAAELYRLALKTLDEGTAEHRAALRSLADALRNASRGPEAGQAYLDAARVAESDADRLECERRAFEQYLVSGYLEKGHELAAKVLAAVDLPLPSGRFGTLASLLVQRARVRLRGTKFEPRAAAELPEAARTRSDVCWSMALGLSLIDNKLGALYSARFARLALDGGDPERVSRGLAMETGHQGGSGNFERAERLITEAERLASECQSPHAIAFASQMRGWLEYFQGRYQRALACYDASSQLLRAKCAGVSWEISSAEMMATWSLVYLGQWNELQARYGPLMSEARQTGDLYRVDSLGIIGGVTTGLMNDDLAGVRSLMAELAHAWNPSGFQLQHFFRLLIGGWVSLYAGDQVDYWPKLLEQWKPLKASLLLTVVEIKYRMHMVRGWAAVAQPDSKEMRAQALASAKVLAGMRSTGALGISKTVQAALLARDQKTEAALAELKAAIDDYSKAGMSMLSACAQWRLGRLEGGDLGKARVDAAQKLMLGCGIKRPERVVAMFAPGFAD